ncbi:MAG: IspD/TarI family cytidylyltransferase [Planctomycetia bacterium]|nr:IspD/TarI family cytidylyltransferase [Planctomycetia bacterium]
MAKYCVILPAAGKSSRFRDFNYKKPFFFLKNRAVWLHSARLFLNRKDVAQVILVISPEDKEDVLEKFRAEIAVLDITLAEGGKERADSIENAIPLIKEECDFVCVHDAARPCLTQALVDKVFLAAENRGAAILAVPIADSLKKVQPSDSSVRNKKKRGGGLDMLFSDPDEECATEDGIILASMERGGIWYAQTPQVFRKDWFIDVYAHRNRDESAQTTDDAMLFEKAGKSVFVVEGSPCNIKITTKADLELARAVLDALPEPKKTSFHPFSDES